MIEISIVIPFYGDLEGLRATLRALRFQTWPEENRETLVIDNGEIETTGPLKEEFPDVRWLRESKVGSYAARNHGLDHAQGRIIAFTDADCVPDENWLFAGKEALNRFGASVVGGKIEYINPEGRGLNVYEIIEETFFLLSRQQYLIERLNVAATANMFTVRNAFDRIGRFNSALKSFGDGDWTRRAVAQGEKLAYAERAIVRHPRRNSLDAIVRKWVRVAGGRISQIRQSKPSVRRYAAALLNDSWLDPRIHAAPLKSPGLSLVKRMHLFLVLEYVSFRITCAKIWVLCGGTANRG